MIEHGPHWINFTILTFIIEKIDILDAYIKFGTILFYLTWKKKGNLRQIIGKVKEKMNLSVLGMNL